MKYIFFSLFLFIISVAFAARPSSPIRQPSTANCQLSKVNCQLPTANHQPSAQLNRTAFYKAMEENDKTLVNAQLDELKTLPEDIRPAFMGAMIMKKSGMGGAPATRLHLFKEGRKMLEEAIRQDPGNAEYRFLRLMIQEHAPGSLGYHNDLETDSEYIRKSYKSMPGEVRQFIADYDKNSKVLKLGVS